MKTKVMLAAALALALGTAGAGAAESGTDSKPDAWITMKVKSKLAAGKDASAMKTNVDTKDGIVTLNGEVSSEAEKELAEEYAREVEGVREVDNRLVVKSESREARDASARESERQDSRERRGVERTESGAAKGPGDTLFDKVDDRAISSRVKAALAANRATSALNTEVETRGGIVTLRGVARSDAERTLAERYAKEVKGVKSVDNRIEVRP